jgi:hypothetical protein
VTTHTDILVAGGTPGGIAAAVRAAREGQDTTLVARNDHLGGMMAGGLSYTDTQVTKPRAPLLEAFVGAVREHYAETCGRDSPDFEACEEGYIFEPHVAEETFEELVDDAGVEVRRGRRPTSVDRAGRSIEAVTFEAVDGTGAERIAADVTVEATYEGDVAALAGVPYRVGRESRRRHAEQFAGELYTVGGTNRYYPMAAVGDADNDVPSGTRGPLDVPDDRQSGDLGILPHPWNMSDIAPHSTGAGDDAVQAYNYRLCLSRDPENRRRPDRPPDYDRSKYVDEVSPLKGRTLPDDKVDLNTADLPGANHAYPEADAETRAEIGRKHRNHVLGLIYFLQNDDAVPDDVQSEARRWGLALDEFEDNDNFPWQLYVREARRIEGRATFTESDARHARGIDRTPIHADSVAFAEYPLDSHACRSEEQAGRPGDGNFFAARVTRPSQVPYRTLLPVDVDDLLAPVPLSATHVGFSTIRLEPTWMHVGEAAGFAAVRAVETGRPPAEIDVVGLQTALAEAGHTCSFFNDCDAASDASWRPAVDVLGTKGFFRSYDARARDPLREGVADAWAATAAALLDGALVDPTDRARDVPEADAGSPVSGAAFRERLTDAGVDAEEAGSSADSITRGEACEAVYRLLTGASG